MITLYILAYVLLLVSFLFVERFVRTGKDTKALDKTRHDKGSTNTLVWAFAISFVLLAVSPILNAYGIGALKAKLILSIVGLIIEVLGILVRVIAVHTLGRFYTRILRETDEHRLVTNGIYRYIRHPGYLGNILLFLGASLVMGNIITILTVAVLIAGVYIYRIAAEEKMLIELFGTAYLAYQKQSRRLIPWVY